MQPVWATKNAAALQVLQQAHLARQSDHSSQGSGSVILPGDARSSIAPLNGVARQAQAVITESLFSASVVDVNQMKIHLMERLGKELGISMEDFKSGSEFGKAVKQAIVAIKMTENGDLRLREIADKLGLDKLGVSLDTLVDAIADPDGGADDELEAALLKQANGNADGAVDAISRYEF